MATTDYQAAIDTGDVILAYGKESAWGSIPAVSFQQVRILGESLAGTKSRTRPGEITSTPQVAAALTTKVEAGGEVNMAWSYATFDDFLAASIRNDWSTAVNMSATTIAATASGFTDSANGFVTGGIVAGQFIKIAGFTGGGAASINGFYRVDTVAAGVLTTTPVPGATKTAGDTVTAKGTTIRNSNVFQSFYLQKQLAVDKFLHYAGAWPTGGSFEVGVGDFAKGSFPFLAKSEVKSLTDGSTGAQTAAPTGNVINAISGIGDLRRNGVVIDAVIQKIAMKWQAEGSRVQMGIGSSAAQGIGTGQLSLNGSLETYFKDFSLYDEFISELGGPISFHVYDNTGAGYYFTVCNATIMNPKIVAGGPNQDVVAVFELEGNPGAALFGGKTIQIDKFAA